MALDAESLDKLKKFINEKWNTKLCSLCSRNSWVFNGHFSLVLSDEVLKNDLEGKALPCVAAVCTNCGNTILINTLVAGLGSK